jgi:signal transduction histidine kinase
MTGQLLKEGIAADVAAVAQIDAVPRILEVVCRATGMGFAAIARVTENRWVACAVRDKIAFGLTPGGELDVRTTLCDEVRASRQLVVIEDVAKDDTYCGHQTPKMYGFRSYISVPIYLPGGDFFGTLCAIHPEPAPVNTPETIDMFTLFADLVGFHLDARARLKVSERALSDERRGAELRDQFIAVLGHDLRNPLAAIQMGGKLLARMPLDEQGRRAAAVIQSSAARASGLVENVLDFARGQLGEGLPVTLETITDLDTTLDQVVTELRTTWPGRDVRTRFALARPVTCDRSRISQLLSNLLANALTHGDPSGPVQVSAESDDGGFALAVVNGGAPIPEEIRGQLFQPFARTSGGDGQGLGLGLYIASEIARAHAGTIDVTSTADETRFTFRMPNPPVG